MFGRATAPSDFVKQRPKADRTLRAGLVSGIGVGHPTAFPSSSSSFMPTPVGPKTDQFREIVRVAMMSAAVERAAVDDRGALASVR